MSDRPIPPGRMSLYETPEHPFKASGKWFRTQHLADQYSEKDRVYRRAKRAGFGTTPEEIELFLKSERIRKDLAQREKDRLARERAERDAIRAKHGLHKKAKVSALVASEEVRRDARQYLSKVVRDRMTDSERLDLLRKMYRHRHQMSPADLLIRIGNVLGEPQ